MRYVALSSQCQEGKEEIIINPAFKGKLMPGFAKKLHGTFYVVPTNPTFNPNLKPYFENHIRL